MSIVVCNESIVFKLMSTFPVMSTTEMDIISWFFETILMLSELGFGYNIIPFENGVSSMPNSGTTVNSKEQLLVLPSSSVDSKEMVCVPSVNSIPAAGDYYIVSPVLQLSVAVTLPFVT